LGLSAKRKYENIRKRKYEKIFIIKLSQRINSHFAK